ncbi:sugar phosphate isomerase/epimerase family protein [Aestuariimicrobium sp. T2.26MG-19.2B]|uniref:sugar phosphate isomerase/epimerase family protein n=1 Tax=Aestuariimicrobium sp. T2.26MG-19.2B TaxID=3040679 RepID=UPI002477C06C|nr:TIM barrel protein [Aestuariimicrobium sp. T2.26MG-19.2B]CAI9403430.1 hypothetical protein AESSP_01002 [Aestuariimicrobium sp. T2.26MG-19.2B]
MASLGCVINPSMVLPDTLDADFVEPCLMGRFVGSENGRTVVLPRATHGLGGLPVKGAAVLFPGDLALADPATPLEHITQHLDRVAESLAAVSDGGWVVLGSGASRTIPAHVEREVGLARLAEVVGEATQRFAAVGFEVLLEPLRKSESNVFNNLGETAEYLDEHGLGNRMVCDTYHLFSEGLTSPHAVAQVGRIGHVHLSGHDRLPVHRDADAVFEVSDALVAAGYQGRFSLECAWPNGVDDLIADLAVCRERLPVG